MVRQSIVVARRPSKVVIGEATFCAVLGVVLLTTTMSNWRHLRRLLLTLAHAGALATVVLANVAVVLAFVVVFAVVLRRLAAPLANARRWALFSTGTVRAVVWLPSMIEAVANEGGNAVGLVHAVANDSGGIHGFPLKHPRLTRGAPASA